MFTIHQYNNFLRSLVLAFLIWVPLPAGSNWPWSSALILALLPTLGVLALLGRQHEKQQIKPQSYFYIAQALLGLTAAWMFIQWHFKLSSDPGETLTQAIFSANLAILFWLVVRLFNTRKYLNWLLGTLIVSGTFQAFFGAFMTLSGTEWLLFGPKEYGKGVVTGTFVNRNHLAGYLEMTIACGIGLMLALRDGKDVSWRGILEVLISNKALIRIALVIMVIALVMSQSRMGNTGFFSSLLIIGGLFIVAKKEHRVRNSLILASLILIDVVVISQYFGLDNLRNRLLQTQLEDKIVAGEIVRRENVDRDDVARYAVSQLKERPWLGYGAGSFEATYQKWAGADIVLDFDHAHNDYLEFLLELGIIGVIPLVLFTGLCLSRALVALWHRKSLYRSGVGFGAAMAITSLLIHSTSDFNLQIPANSTTFVAICAIALLANSHQYRRPTSRPSGRQAP